MDFDLIIRGAIIYDGTGAPGYVADVGVVGDKIETIGRLAGVAAAREVSAAKFALAPGFIDIHGHSDYYLLVLPSAESKVLQGVTTEIGGNCGYSPAPVRGRLFEDRRRDHLELFNLNADWHEFGEYLERLEAMRPSINYAPLVGFNTIRAAVDWYKNEPPPAETLAEMRAMVKRAMDQGAVGLSYGLIYTPASFAALDELAACGQEAANAGGFLASHIRSEGDKIIDAIEESIEICRRTGAPFQISHLKTSGIRNWGKLERVFDLIEKARASGLPVSADRYPYIASFTGLSSALPNWVMEGGKDAFFARLADAGQRKKMRDELELSDPMNDRWERIMVAQVFHPELSRYEGKFIAEAAKADNQDPVDFLCGLVIESKDRASAIYHTMSSGNLERIYKKDWVSIGSDSAVRAHVGTLSEGYPHPRTFGTFPRVLSWVVREKRWLDLPTAVRRMTALPAEQAGLRQRGKILAGWHADLCLFDPGKAADTATYEKPVQYPVGIEMVIVNGKIVAEHGRMTDARPGRVLRRGS